ncbi:MAG: methyltransferase/methylesterase, CheR/CheB with sensor [Rhodospirillales bacterium]|nr:methyltransferase/methylesterase, CheR/CheB with sensor [Rhodospirillales bacterium]
MVVLTEPLGEGSKLSLLADIQRLALCGDDLGEILQGAIERLAAGLGAKQAVISSPGGDESLSIAASIGVKKVNDLDFGAVEGWFASDVAADGILYGTVRLDLGEIDLSVDDRAFVSVVKGLLATAFIRLSASRLSASMEEPALYPGDHLLPSAELIRRVRNVLSVIRVIARRTAEKSTSIDDYAAQLDGRISALARVQTALVTSFRNSTDLGKLIDDEMVAQSIKGGRMRARGPRIPLRPRAAETLGLTVHELAENAIKYGALSAKDGKVDVLWWIDEGTSPRQLRLEWVETGVPILSAAPRTMGFGHELIQRTLPYELFAKTSVAFRPGGFRCEMAIPLSDRVLPSDAPRVQ